jgi:hypothetical protein
MLQNQKLFWPNLKEKQLQTPSTLGKCSSLAVAPMMQKIWKNILHLLI